MIKGLIFDLDGTLVDTIPVYLAAYVQIIESEFNIKADEEKIKDQFGKRATDIMVALLEDMGLDPKKIDIDKLINKIREKFMGNFEDILILPGARSLLEELKKSKKYKIALATSSRAYVADAILDRFDLRKYFDAVVTADNVVNSKPDPEIFLFAAKQLGLLPEQCVVFEDAIHGVVAAGRAGMKTVGLTTGVCTKEELKQVGADLLFDSLEEFLVADLDNL